MSRASSAARDSNPPRRPLPVRKDDAEEANEIVLRVDRSELLIELRQSNPNDSTVSTTTGGTRVRLQ